MRVYVLFAFVLAIAVLVTADHHGDHGEVEICTANRSWRPVCGDDGKTYANRDVLKCDNEENVKEGKAEVQEAHEGEC